MPSLYKEIGARETLDKAAKIMYQRVLQDDTLAPFFDGLDMDEQIQKFYAFLIFATGGPHHYSPLDLVTAHADAVLKGLRGEHIDTMFKHLRAALGEIDVSEKHIDQVIAQLERFRGHVLGT